MHSINWKTNISKRVVLRFWSNTLQSQLQFHPTSLKKSTQLKKHIQTSHTSCLVWLGCKPKEFLGFAVSSLWLWAPLTSLKSPRRLAQPSTRILHLEVPKMGQSVAILHCVVPKMPLGWNQQAPKASIQIGTHTNYLREPNKKCTALVWREFAQLPIKSLSHLKDVTWGAPTQQVGTILHGCLASGFYHFGCWELGASSLQWRQRLSNFLTNWRRVSKKSLLHLSARTNYGWLDGLGRLFQKWFCISATACSQFCQPSLSSFVERSCVDMTLTRRRPYWELDLLKVSTCNSPHCTKCFQVFSCH